MDFIRGGVVSHFGLRSPRRALPRRLGFAGLGSPSNLDNLSMMICPILADCVVKAPSKTFGNLSSPCNQPRVPILQRALGRALPAIQIKLG